MSYLVVLGLNRADMVWLPMNYRNTLETTIEQLDFFDTDCLCYHSQFVAEIAEIRKRVSSLKTTICIDASSEHGHALPALLETASPRHYNEPEDPMADSVIWLRGYNRSFKGRLAKSPRRRGYANQSYALDIPEHPRYLAVAPITHAAGYFCPFFTRGEPPPLYCRDLIARQSWKRLNVKKSPICIYPPQRFIPYSIFPISINLIRVACRNFMSALPRSRRTASSRRSMFWPRSGGTLRSIRSLFPATYKIGQGLLSMISIQHV